MSEQAPKDVLYKPGISFTNPPMVKVAAPVRSNPWFWEDKGVGPLSASEKIKRFESTNGLTRYKPIWSRVAKSRNTERLGAYFADVPTINELGAAPPATAETNSASRDPLGFLDNILTAAEKGAQSVTDVLLKREASKTAMAQASMTPYIPFINQGGSGNTTMIILGGLAAVGLGIYFLRR